jgi:cation-transporting ATPase F
LLTGDVVGRILLVSVLPLSAAFALFERELGAGHSDAEARTIAANVFVFVEIAYVFNCRSFTGRAVDLGLFSSRWLLAGVALTVALQLLFMSSAPMNDLFGTAPIDARGWFEAIVVAGGIVEFEKAIRRRRAGRLAPRSRQGSHTHIPPSAARGRSKGRRRTLRS